VTVVKGINGGVFMPTKPEDVSEYVPTHGGFGKELSATGHEILKLMSEQPTAYYDVPEIKAHLKTLAATNPSLKEDDSFKHVGKFLWVQGVQNAKSPKKTPTVERGTSDDGKTVWRITEAGLKKIGANTNPAPVATETAEVKTEAVSEPKKPLTRKERRALRNKQ
jgi:hypothetical protein